MIVTDSTYKIALKGMRFNAKIGVTETERKVGTEIIVNVNVSVKRNCIAKMLEDDDINFVVDYGKMYNTVKRVVCNSSFKLIETLAYAVGNAVMNNYDVSETSVAIEKLNPPVGGDCKCASVTLHFSTKDVNS